MRANTIRHRHPPSIPTPAMYRTFADMAAARCTQHEIAAEIGVTQATIMRWHRRFGVPTMSRAEGRAASLARRT